MTDTETPKPAVTVTAPDLSGATAAFFAALYKAQQNAESAAKDSKQKGGGNGDRRGGPRFDYSSHDEISRVAKQALASASLVWWDTMSEDSTGALVMHWGLELAGGEETGAIRGTSRISDWRSPQMSTGQAQGAARSYMRKYQLTGLLLLDRAEDLDDHHTRRPPAIDGRGRPARPPEKPKPAPGFVEAEKAMNDALRRYVSECRRVTGERLSMREVLTAANGGKALPAKPTVTALHNVREWLQAKTQALHDEDGPPEDYEPADGQGMHVPGEDDPI